MVTNGVVRYLQESRVVINALFVQNPSSSLQPSFITKTPVSFPSALTQLSEGRLQTLEHWVSPANILPAKTYIRRKTLDSLSI